MPFELSAAELEAMDCSTDPACTETKLIYDEIFTEAQYSCNGAVTLSSGDVIVDCGAHVGLFALWCCKQAPIVRVVAFEPMNAQYAALAANMARAGVAAGGATGGAGAGAGAGAGPVVECVQCGVGAAVQEAAEFTFFEKTPGNSTCKHEEKTAQLQHCMRADFRTAWTVEHHPITTLHAAISVHKLDRIDLLKVDVEGSEVDVLAGLGMFDWLKIKQVVLEVYNIEGRAAELTALLQSRGFTTKLIATADTRFTKNVLLVGTRIQNIIATAAAAAAAAVQQGEEQGGGHGREKELQGGEAEHGKNDERPAILPGTHSLLFPPGTHSLLFLPELFSLSRSLALSLSFRYFPTTCCLLFSLSFFSRLLSLSLSLSLAHSLAHTLAHSLALLVLCAYVILSYLHRIAHLHRTVAHLHRTTAPGTVLHHGAALHQ
jgi:FkbM family methyltransferase